MSRATRIVLSRMLQALAATLPLALGKMIAVAPTMAVIVALAGRYGTSFDVAMILG